MQAEFAQLLYYLPRASAYFSTLVEVTRRSGSPRCLQSPCGTFLETDARVMRKRLSVLRQELYSLRTQRAAQRENRRRTGMPSVVIVGYPGSGKSTVFSSLTQSKEMQRTTTTTFATLSPVARKVLPKAILDSSLRFQGTEFILVDTMGMVDELPAELREAFVASLGDELLSADVLLHVCDFSHPHFRKRQTAILRILTDMGCGDKALVTLYNERSGPTTMRATTSRRTVVFPHVEDFSGPEGIHLKAVLEVIQNSVLGRMEKLDIVLPYFRTSTWTFLNAVFRLGGLLDIAYEEGGVRIRGRVPKKLCCEIKQHRSDLEGLESSKEQPQRETSFDASSVYRPRSLLSQLRQRIAVVDLA